MRKNLKPRKEHWESYDNIDGLGSHCWRLLEDREGSIWIGTWGGGLSKYDGKRFVNFTTEAGLSGNNVSCLLQDSEGNIWIGTGSWNEAGPSGLTKYDGKEFISFTTKDGLASNNILSICQDRAGNIWVGTGSWSGAGGCGLSKYDGKRFVNFTTKDGLAGNNISCMLGDKEGNIWVGTGSWNEPEAKGLNKYDGKQFLNYTTQDGLAGNNISCMLEDKEGNLWVGTWGSGLSKYDGKRFVNFTGKDGLAGDNVWCLYQDRVGNVWIGTGDGGVSCYNGSEFINFTAEDGLANNSVLHIIQDREGSLWFACAQGGVSRYNPYDVSAISDEAVSEVIIQGKSGNLWWGYRNILSQFDGKDVNHYLFEDEDPAFENAIFELFEDSKGQLWIGTRDKGIYRYDNIEAIKGQKPRNFTTDDGLVSNAIWRIYEEAYTVIGRFAQQLFPDEAGAIYIIDNSRKLIESISIWGLPPPLPDTSVFSINECWALRLGRRHLVEDTKSDLVCGHVHQPLPAEYLCLPMIAQGETLGVLHLSQSTTGPLTEAKQQLAITVAEHIAMSLANLKLREILRNQSIRDPLTGLFNRLYMEESVDREIHRARRHRTPTGIIMLDLDHFKRINDTLGHEAGDVALRELGHLLLGRLRREDIACRYGGEEFVIILPNTSLADAHNLAEQLREQIKTLSVPYRHQRVGPFTASMGVAIFPDHGMTKEDVLRAADRVLYQAKREGRDRVITSK